jgi:hypothetical protein
MTHHPTRRALLSALAISPLAAAPLAAAVAGSVSSGSSADAAILAAWERRKSAHMAIDALPDEQCGQCFDSPAEVVLWSAAEAAEAVICDTEARTPRGVAIKLMTALAHNLDDRDTSSAADRGDMPALMRFEERFEPDARMILSALRSLEAMEA